MGTRYPNITYFYINNTYRVVVNVKRGRIFCNKLLVICSQRVLFAYRSVGWVNLIRKKKREKKITNNMRRVLVFYEILNEKVGS